ncbi:hypothetical protein, partial [Streptomyces sp.]|uniref:hypothetical protein n=1 Tax=Streptomyces sp. TaxID=1931 RepID=UPI002F40858E
MLAAAAVAGAVLVGLPLALSHNDNDNEIDYEAAGLESVSPRTLGPSFTLDVPARQSDQGAGSRITQPDSTAETPSSSSSASAAPTLRVSPPKSFQGPGIRAPHPETATVPRSRSLAPAAVA